MTAAEVNHINMTILYTLSLILTHKHTHMCTHKQTTHINTGMYRMICVHQTQFNSHYVLPLDTDQIEHNININQKCWQAKTNKQRTSTTKKVKCIKQTRPIHREGERESERERVKNRERKETRDKEIKKHHQQKTTQAVL